MLDKSIYGHRYTCFECGQKFYDLNRPTATCPDCGANQGEAPVQDIRALLSRGSGPRAKAAPIEEKPKTEDVDESFDNDEDEDEDGDMDLGLGDLDDDGDDDAGLLSDDLDDTPDAL